jgi:hypothetical protein
MKKVFNIYSLCIVLIASLFSALYLRNIFFNIEDISLITALETDVGSIMTSIQDLFKTPYYSMFNGYHSKFYGWSYYTLNFIILIPVKLAAYIISFLYNFNYDMPVFFTVRLNHFLLGLASSIMIFKVLTIKSFFKKKINVAVAFCASLTFLTIPVAPSLFVFVHPEILGIFLTLVTIFLLLKFIATLNLNYYYYSVIALSIAIMTKQPFIFTSIPIMFSFAYFYIKSLDTPCIKFIKSYEMWVIFKKTTILSVCVAFVIHPYLFFRLPFFFEIQTQLLNTFSGDISYLNSLLNWTQLLYGFNPGGAFNLIFVTSFYLLPATFIISSIIFLKQKNNYSLLPVMNSLAILLFVLILAYGNRTFFFPTYISPIYIFLIFNLVFAFTFPVNLIKNIIFKIIFSLFIGLIIFLQATLNIINIIDESKSRISTNSLPHRTFEFITNNIKVGDKIVYDHFVAIPAPYMKSAGHYWHGYGTDLIETFNPKYVIFNAEYPTKNIYTDRLKKYVSDHNMKLIETLGAPNQKWMIVNPDSNAHTLYSSSKVFIYIKP